MAGKVAAHGFDLVPVPALLGAAVPRGGTGLLYGNMPDRRA
jgi:hypothetical protein